MIQWAVNIGASARNPITATLQSSVKNPNTLAGLGLNNMAKRTKSFLVSNGCLRFQLPSAYSHSGEGDQHVINVCCLWGVTFSSWLSLLNDKLHSGLVLERHVRSFKVGHYEMSFFEFDLMMGISSSTHNHGLFVGLGFISSN